MCSRANTRGPPQLDSRFEAVHNEEATGNLSLCGSGRAGFFAIGYRRVANVFVKQATERAKTLKPDFEAHVRHAQVV